jgi:hypothetical protein
LITGKYQDRYLVEYTREDGYGRVGITFIEFCVYNAAAFNP